MPMPAQLAAALGKSQGQNTQGAASVGKEIPGKKGKIPPQFLKHAAKRRLKNPPPKGKGKSPIQAIANKENAIEQANKGKPKSAKELALEAMMKKMSGRG